MSMVGGGGAVLALMGGKLAVLDAGGALCGCGAGGALPVPLLGGIIGWEGGPPDGGGE